MSAVKQCKAGAMMKLNVGGTTYATSSMTLCKYPDSMLARMINGDFPTTIDENGALFIDRYATNGVQNVDGISKAIWGMISWGFGPVESDSEVKNGQIWQDPLPHSALIEHTGPRTSILAIFFTFQLI